MATLMEAAVGEVEENKQSNLATNYSLVREALVREIGEADRWSAVMDAWNALLHVRFMARAMLTERIETALEKCDRVGDRSECENEGVS